MEHHADEADEEAAFRPAVRSSSAEKRSAMAPEALQILLLALP